MCLRSECPLKISAGFLFLTVWFAAVNGWRLLFLILGAAAVHELGHLWMLRLLGARIFGLQITILGAVLEADCRTLSYGKELAAVLAGPAVNLLFAFLSEWFGPGNDTAIGIHLVLGGFNLLPIRPLDGGRALDLLLVWLFGPYTGETVVRWISSAAALILAAIVIWLMASTGGSLWLLPAAAGLLGAAGREWLGK